MCALAKIKAMYKYIDLIVESYEEYFEISFFGWGSPPGFNYRHYCSTVKGGADQNRMTVDVRGKALKIFHLAEVINE